MAAPLLMLGTATVSSAPLGFPGVAACAGPLYFFLAGAFLAGALLAGAFFTAAFLAGAFFAGALFAATFFLAGAFFTAAFFLAGAFFAAAFFLAGAFFTAAFFLAGAFFAAAFFLAGAFLAGVFFAAAFFLAGAFFAAAFFLAGAFLAGAFFAAGFLAGAFAVALLIATETLRCGRMKTAWDARVCKFISCLLATVLFSTCSTCRTAICFPYEMLRVCEAPTPGGDRLEPDLEESLSSGYDDR